jgi:hypothetical protein
VTLLFGHLHRPISIKVLYPSSVQWYEPELKQKICKRCHLIISNFYYYTSTSFVTSNTFRHVLLSKPHQFQYRIIFGLLHIEKAVRISSTNSANLKSNNWRPNQNCPNTSVTIFTLLPKRGQRFNYGADSLRRSIPGILALESVDFAAGYYTVVGFVGQHCLEL